MLDIYRILVSLVLTKITKLKHQTCTIADNLWKHIILFCVFFLYSVCIVAHLYNTFLFLK
jgi:hypothetical protein